MTQPQRPRAVNVVVATTVMLSFISFWRAAAIVLSDLASSAYYVGGIAEQAIGKAAPWFILAIMLFSYSVRAIYIESCSMFVRGGVYKVVHEAMGGTLAKFFRRSLLVALCGAAVSGTPCPASPVTYRVVAYLNNQTQEAVGIIEGSPGVFYSNSSGTEIFSAAKQGATTILASFPDPPYTVGSAPGAMAANALLYSSVGQVGSGSIFSVGPTAGTETTYPASSFSLIPVAGNLPNGNLFGLAGNYSNNSYNLAIIDLSGKVTPFYQFSSTDRPAPPIYADDGSYYGVSEAAVDGSTAYFYRVTPSGTFTNLFSLPFVKTAFAGSGLVLEGSDGNFYGIQSTGLGCSSANQHGAVYKLTPAGQYTILHDFGVCGHGVVNSLIEASDGKLYGAIQGNSVLFSLTKSGAYKAEFIPSDGSTQGLCICTLVQGSDGIIYGTAVGGGPGGAGVIFALNAGLPRPKPRAREFTPRSGPVGTQVRIWGQNLLAAAVQFNGTAATTVSNAGPNYVWATVPAGATSGPITVTTPGGTSTTHARFKVD